MNFKPAAQNDERAVSPVIGVILMVAITVILAAVIGTFVLGLGDQLGDTAPQASYDVDDVTTGTDGTIEVTKTGGQDIAVSDLRVVVDVAGSSSEFDLANISGAGNWRTADTATIDVESTSAESISLRSKSTTGESNIDQIDAGDDVTVTIVHKPSGGTIAELSATA
jgi:flagellin-like protein